MLAALTPLLLGFSAPLGRQPVSSRSHVVMEKSKSVPFVEANPVLSGMVGGETAFDPLSTREGWSGSGRPETNAPGCAFSARHQGQCCLYA